MRKALALVLLSFMLVTCLIVSPVVYANSDVSVYLNGTKVNFDEPPCIINDRTLVPIRGVLEAAGATVTWDNDLRMTVAKKDNTIIWVGVDEPAMTVQKDGITYVVGFDVAPCIINDRTYVAIKNVANAFDINMNWNQQTRTVELTTDDTAAYDIENSINISEFSAPESLNVGRSYILKGDVMSDGILDRLNVKVTDIASGKVQINETAFDIDMSTYSLSDIDSRIKFGTLSAGEKLLEITAVTKNETREVFSYEFSVIRPSGVTIENPSQMLWPVPDSGLITTIFWCDNPFCHSNAGRVNGHAAIDIAAPENSDVIAVMDGIVKSAGFGNYENGNTGYGNYIQLDHGDGLITQYSHLYSIYVSEGESITAGQVIGGVGNTGNSTGNHLDFKIELDGKRCDPLYYLDMHPNARCYEDCDKPYFDKALSERALK